MLNIKNFVICYNSYLSNKCVSTHNLYMKHRAILLISIMKD